MSNDNTKLAITATAAALAGAVTAVGVLKYLDRKSAPRPRKVISVPSVISNRDEGKLMPHQHEEKMKRQIAARALVEEDNFQPRDSVTVRVPATSANMGPGCE